MAPFARRSWRCVMRVCSGALAVRVGIDRCIVSLISYMWSGCLQFHTFARTLDALLDVREFSRVCVACSEMVFRGGEIFHLFGAGNSPDVSCISYVRTHVK